MGENVLMNDGNWYITQIVFQVLKVNLFLTVTHNN